MNDDITALEIEAGVIAVEKGNLPKNIKDPQELALYAVQNPEGFNYVNYEDRKEFLIGSGYELTRENFVDASLPNVQLDTEQDDETTDEES